MAAADPPLHLPAATASSKAYEACRKTRAARAAVASLKARPRPSARRRCAPPDKPRAPAAGQFQTARRRQAGAQVHKGGRRRAREERIGVGLEEEH